MGLDAESVVASFHEKVLHPPKDMANSATYVRALNVSDVVPSLPVNSPHISVHPAPLLLGHKHTVRDDVIDTGSQGMFETARSTFER